MKIFSLSIRFVTFFFRSRLCKKKMEYIYICHNVQVIYTHTHTQTKCLHVHFRLAYMCSHLNVNRYCPYAILISFHCQYSTRIVHYEIMSRLKWTQNDNINRLLQRYSFSENYWNKKWYSSTLFVHWQSKLVRILYNVSNIPSMKKKIEYEQEYREVKAKIKNKETKSYQG